MAPVSASEASSGLTSFERLVTELSVRFLSTSPTLEEDRAFQDVLPPIRDFFRADRAYLCLFEGDDQSLCLTYVSDPDQRSLPRRLPADRAPWALEKIRRGQSVRIPEMDRLPETAAADLGHWRQRGVTAVLAAPLFAGGEPIGFLGCDALGSPVSWGAREEEWATALGAILGNALGRRQAEQRLRASEERYRSLIDVLPYGIQECDLEGRITFTSPGYDRMMASAPGAWLGQPIWASEATQESGAALRDHFAVLVREQPHPEPYFSRARRMDGRIIDIRVDWTYRRDDRGRLTGFIAATTDRTEEVERAQQLQVLEKAVETTSVGIVVTDLEGKILFANPAEARMHGYRPDELVDRPANMLGPAPLRKSWTPEQLRTWQRESKNITRDGRCFPVRLTSDTVLDMEGKPAFLVTVCEDISEARKLQENLRESQDFLRSVLDHMGDGLSLSDADGRLVEVNRQLCDSVGFTREELLGRTVPDFDPNFPLDKYRQVFAQLPPGGSMIVESLNLRRDGTSFPVELQVTGVRLGGEDLALTIVRDITRRKAAERALRESEERFRELVDLFPQTIFEADFQGRFTFANRHGLETFGYEPEDLVRGLHLAETVGPDQHQDVVENIRRLMVGEAVKQPTQRLMRRRDGSTFPALVYFSPILRDGRPSGLRGLVADISEQKRLEEALAASEAGYRSLFENSPVSIWVEDFSALRPLFEDWRSAGVRNFPDFFRKYPEQVAAGAERIKILDVNRATLELYQAQCPDELLGSLDRILGEESLPALAKVLAGLAEGRTRIEVESTNRTLQGEMRHVNLRLNVAPGHEESLDRAFVTITDLTTWREAQAELQDAWVRLETILGTSQAGIAVTRHRDGRFIEINPAFCRMYQLTADQVIGRSSVEIGLLTPGQRRDMVRVIEKNGSVTDWELPFTTADGKRRTMLHSIVPVLLGGEECLIGTMIEITAIKEAQEGLRKVLDTPYVGIVISRHKDGLFRFGNKAFHEMFGYREGDLVGSSSLSKGFFTPEQRRAMLEELESNGSIRGLELSFENRSGESRDYLFSATPLNYEGEACILTSLTDITENRRNQRRLLEVQERLAKAFNTPYVGIAVARRKDGVYIEANEAFFELYGYSREEVLGRSTVELGFITPGGREALLDEIDRRGEIRNREITVATKTGREVTVLLSLSPVRVRDEDCLLSTMIDVTATRRAQEALRHSEALYRSLFENSPVSLWEEDLSGIRRYFKALEARGITDFEGHILQDPEELAACLAALRVINVNRRTLELYGAAKKEELLQAVPALFTPDSLEALVGGLERLVAGSGHVEVETVNRRLDGTEINILLKASPLPGHETDLGRVIVSITDITERSRAEAALKKSLAEKEVLVREVHHRVKNNLQLVTSLLRLQIQGADEPGLRERLELVHGRIRAIALLHEKLYRAGDLAAVEFSEYIRDLVDRLETIHQSEAKGRHVRLQTDPLLLPVDLAIPCGMILNELLSNALRHAFPEGHTGTVRVEFTRQGSGGRITVRDDGVGLPSDQGDADAGGIGLVLVRRLTEQIRGRLTLQSNPGTVAEVRFPLPPDAGGETMNPPEGQER